MAPSDSSVVSVGLNHTPQHIKLGRIGPFSKGSDGAYVIHITASQRRYAMGNKPPTFVSDPDRLRKPHSDRDPEGSAMSTIQAERNAAREKSERLRALRMAELSKA